MIFQTYCGLFMFQVTGMRLKANLASFHKWLSIRLR